MKNNLTAKQQQLVNEILNRKQLGLESLVEATLKSDKNDTKEEIIKKQKEILSRKEKENQEKLHSCVYNKMQERSANSNYEYVCIRIVYDDWSK